MGTDCGDTLQHVLQLLYYDFLHKLNKNDFFSAPITLNRFRTVYYSSTLKHVSSFLSALVSVVVETTCFETKIEIKTGKIFRDQDRDQNQSSFETSGSRPRPGIIETKTETGNYSASKNKSLSPSLINIFFIFPKSCNYNSSERGFLKFPKRALLSVVALSTRLC